MEEMARRTSHDTLCKPHLFPFTPLPNVKRNHPYLALYCYILVVTNAWCAQPGPKMGHAARKCMTAGEDHPQFPHAKRRDSGSPGPGAYATGDSAVMSNRGGTFAAVDERRGAAAALEMAVGRLKTLEWRIGFVRRGEREPEG